MSDLFFWQTWDTQNKVLLGVMLLVALGATILAAVSYLLSPEPAILWEVVSKLHSVPIPFYTINLGLLELDFMVENYLITQYFQGSNVNISSTWALIYVLFLGTSIAFSLAVITALSRFWFIFSMAAFVLLMMNFKLEQLLLFGRTDQVGLILAFFLYLPLSYYFQAFRPDINFLRRLLAFGAVTLAFGFLIYSVAQVEAPFLYLANYGIFAPLIATIIFIFLVSHEIVFGFLHITTSGVQSRKSLLHFMVITIFYLTNLLMLYLYNRQKIDWNLIYFSEFLLLMISAIIGFWGIRRRNHLFQNILRFEPEGAYLYLSAAVVCFSTVFYVFVTANDPLIETLEDTIVFSLIGFGVVSVLYVFANFFNLIYYDLPIHKVVYKPRHMPFWTARIGSLLFVLGLVALSDNFPVSQAIAGYYNGVGDLYSIQGQQLLAEGYYENASYYGYQNHRSNYILAQGAFDRGDRPRGYRFLTESVKKKPTPHAFANLANYYDRNNQFFNALFTMNDGLARFPNQPALLNNMALLYGQSTVLDSLFFYAQAGMEHNLSSRQARTNLMAKLIEHDVQVSLDSAEDSFWPADYVPMQANYLAFANKNNHEADLKLQAPLLEDSVLDLEEFSLVFNHMINQSGHLDSSFHSFIDLARIHPSNRWCEENLSLGQALAARRSGNLTRAYRTLQNLRSSTRNAGYYECSMGLWALEERDFERAVTHFESAENLAYPGAPFYRALALLFGGKESEARSAFSELPPNEVISEPYVEKIKKALKADSSEIFQELDAEVKYFWILLNFSQPKEVVEELWRGTEGRIRFEIALGMAHQAMDTRKWGMAYKWMEHARIAAVSEDLADPLNWARLRYSLYTGNFQNLHQIVEKLSPNNPNQRLLAGFLRAKDLERASDLENAEILYRWLATANPYLEGIVIEAARFFEEVLGDSDQAYDLLLQALEFNQSSADLRMAYTLQCLNAGLAHYAELSLKVLRASLENKESQSFEQVYKEKELEMQKNQQWEDQPI